MSTLLDVNSPKSPGLGSANPQPKPVALKTAQPILIVAEIQKLLPHRYPFSLVDRITEYVPGKRAVGIQNMSPSTNPIFKVIFQGNQSCLGS